MEHTFLKVILVKCTVCQSLMQCFYIQRNINFHHFKVRKLQLVRNEMSSSHLLLSRTFSALREIELTRVFIIPHYYVLYCKERKSFGIFIY